MVDKKRLVAFGIAFAIFSASYAFVAWRLGSSPGLFVPSIFLGLSWFIGQVLAESLYLKDPAKWQRTVATLGAILATTVGLGFLVVIGENFTPTTFSSRAIADLVAGFLAVKIGFALPRFRRL